MSAIAERFRAICGRQGEDFTIDAATHRGIFTTILPERTEAFLDPTTLAAAPRPLRAIYVAEDNSAAVGDEIEWQGETLTVLAVETLHFRGAGVAKMVLAA